MSCFYSKQNDQSKNVLFCMFSELIILITRESFQLSRIWRGLNEFNQGFVEALIHNLIDTIVKQRAKLDLK